MYESSSSLNKNNNTTYSLKVSTIDDVNGKGKTIINCFHSIHERLCKYVSDSFSSRTNDTLSRSLKLKLKQRRDKIEQDESTNRTEV